MPGGDNENLTTPHAPGWYPDPFSADGTGERYFDGKRWGTTERPLGRHSAPPADTAMHRRKRGRRARPRSERRGPLRVITAIGVLVGIAVLYSVLHHDGASRRATAKQPGPPNHPPAGAEEAARPRGLPAPVPAGDGQFEVLEHQPSDVSKPVAWDPCRPIHYVVNPAGAPPDGMALIQRAVARVRTATGLQFIYDGPTNERPMKERPAYQPQHYNPDRWAPVLVAWSDERQTPSLAGYIAGLGGPTAESINGARYVDVSGAVILDAEDLSAAKMPDRGVAQSVLLHEFGHLVGLDHTADKREIMFSEAEFNVRDYAVGDLRGLALLGTQPCDPGI